MLTVCLVATLSLSSHKSGSRENGSALITWHLLLHSTEQPTDVNQCFWSKMMKYLLTVQLEKDILHLSISLGNKPMVLRFSQNTLHLQCWVSPFGHFYMACNHFEIVLECESTSCPLARTQGPGAPPTLQPGAPLFAIRVCLLLAVLTQWLPFWTCSRASGAGRGLFTTTHVAAIKRRKGPCFRGPLLLPTLSEIPQSRCYSNWTHFQRLKEGRK